MNYSDERFGCLLAARDWLRSGAETTSATSTRLGLSWMQHRDRAVTRIKVET